ncbi:hypothetical protein P3L10_011064 [Capsicum annuum]
MCCNAFYNCIAVIATILGLFQTISSMIILNATISALSSLKRNVLFSFHVFHPSEFQWSLKIHQKDFQSCSICYLNWNSISRHSVHI